MGNSNEKKKDKLYLEEKFYSEKEKIEKIKIKKELEKEEKIRNDKIKYELNIYVYSNIEVNNYFKQLLLVCNDGAFNWTIKFLEGGFTKQNSNELVECFNEDFKKKTFKNVIIIPINSISDFEKSICQDETNIFKHFIDKKLYNEKQPFFMLFDYDEKDFIKEISSDEVTIEKFFELKRKEIDFDISAEILYEKELNAPEKLENLKNLFIKKKNNKDDFEIIVNTTNIYINIFGEENVELEKFLKVFDDESVDIFIISLVTYNQTTKFRDELKTLKSLKIVTLKFIIWKFKKEKLNNILNKKEYNILDQRNFNVIRGKKSPKFQIIKYTGYFNQFGDILFCEQASYYPAKLNIAVGGFIGSGKSTLINTIFGEKRCLESQGSSVTNYISQYTLKDYPLNFIDFPGFGTKQGDLDNTSLFVDNIKKKMQDMQKINEIIHCFLFCIKFDERIFDEKDNEMKKVFDIIVKLQIKTFFIITQSEPSDNYEFERFKENLINGIRQLENNYKTNNDKILFSNVFGDVENCIIPIYCLKKYSHGNFIKPFGLDNLFTILNESFKSKMINKSKFDELNKKYRDIYNNEERIKFSVEVDAEVQNLIKNNHLLKVYGSKEKFIEGLRAKWKAELTTFIFKTFLVAPKYLYKGKDVLIEFFYDTFYEILIRILSVYKMAVDNENNYEVIIKRFIECIQKDEFTVDNLNDKEMKNFKFPKFLRFIFPILSPIYYLLGGSILAVTTNIWSNKITDIMIEEIVNKNFYECFDILIASFNKGIEALKELSENFENFYKENNN